MSKENKSLTIDTILNSTESLKIIANEDIPINTAVRLTKMIQEVDSTLKIFNKKKSDLFEKYGEKLEDKEGIKIKEEHIDVFNEKYTNLLTEEIDVEIDMVDIKDFGDINVKPSTLLTLGWLINI